MLREGNRLFAGACLANLKFVLYRQCIAHFTCANDMLPQKSQGEFLCDSSLRFTEESLFCLLISPLIFAAARPKEDQRLQFSPASCLSHSLAGPTLPNRICWHQIHFDVETALVFASQRHGIPPLIQDPRVPGHVRRIQVDFIRPFDQSSPSACRRLKRCHVEKLENVKAWSASANKNTTSHPEESNVAKLAAISTGVHFSNQHVRLSVARSITLMIQQPH